MKILILVSALLTTFCSFASDSMWHQEYVESLARQEGMSIQTEVEVWLTCDQDGMKYLLTDRSGNLYSLHVDSIPSMEEYTTGKTVPLVNLKTCEKKTTFLQTVFQ